MHRNFTLALIFVSAAILVSGCGKARDTNPKITDPNVPPLKAIGTSDDPNTGGTNLADPNPGVAPPNLVDPSTRTPVAPPVLKAD